MSKKRKSYIFNAGDFNKMTIVLLALSMFVFSGCNLLPNNKKEVEEEKILGPAKGYNQIVREIQISLKKSNFDPGFSDGRMGWRTREAIRKFQKKNNLKTTGYVDYKTCTKLNIGLEIKRNQNSEQKEKKLANNKDYVISVQDLEKELKTLKGIKRIQQALRNAGYDPGFIDGRVGSRTRKSIAAFQKAKALNITGDIDYATWIELCLYVQD